MTKERIRGRIRVFWPHRRYGYIVPANDFSRDEFCHSNNFLPESDLPEIGSIVEYEIETQPSGRTHAVNVMVVGKSRGVK